MTRFGDYLHAADQDQKSSMAGYAYIINLGLAQAIADGSVKVDGIEANTALKGERIAVPTGLCRYVWPDFTSESITIATGQDFRSCSRLISVRAHLKETPDSLTLGDLAKKMFPDKCQEYMTACERGRRGASAKERGKALEKAEYNDLYDQYRAALKGLDPENIPAKEDHPDPDDFKTDGEYERRVEEYFDTQGDREMDFMRKVIAARRIQGKNFVFSKNFHAVGDILRKNERAAFDDLLDVIDRALDKAATDNPSNPEAFKQLAVGVVSRLEASVPESLIPEYRTAVGEKIVKRLHTTAMTERQHLSREGASPERGLDGKAETEQPSAEEKCVEWLSVLAVEHGDGKPQSKDKIQKIAIGGIQGLSKHAFIRAWATTPDSWKKGGAMKKLNKKIIRPPSAD